MLFIGASGVWHAGQAPGVAVCKFPKMRHSLPQLLRLKLLIKAIVWPFTHLSSCLGPFAFVQENPKGLAVRTGHTELSIALAKAAGVVPVMVGCVMLSNSGDDYGALGPDAAQAWAQANAVPFIEGPELTRHVLSASNGIANGSA